MTDQGIDAAQIAGDFPRRLALTTAVLIALGVAANVNAQEQTPQKLSEVDLSHRSSAQQLIAADFSERPARSSFSAGAITRMVSRNEAAADAGSAVQNAPAARAAALRDANVVATKTGAPGPALAESASRMNSQGLDSAVSVSSAAPLATASMRRPRSSSAHAETHRLVGSSAPAMVQSAAAGAPAPQRSSNAHVVALAPAGSVRPRSEFASLDSNGDSLAFDTPSTSMAGVSRSDRIGQADSASAAVPTGLARSPRPRNPAPAAQPVTAVMAPAPTRPANTTAATLVAVAPGRPRDDQPSAPTASAGTGPAPVKLPDALTAPMAPKQSTPPSQPASTSVAVPAASTPVAYGSGTTSGKPVLVDTKPATAREAATTVSVDSRRAPEPTFTAGATSWLSGTQAAHSAVPAAPTQSRPAAPGVPPGTLPATVAPAKAREPLDIRLSSIPSPEKNGASRISSDWLEDSSSASLAPWNEGSMDETAVRALLRPPVEAAGRNSPRVQQAWSEYLASESDTKAVKGQRWPRVDVSSSTRSYAIGKDDDDNPALRPAVDLQIVTPLYDFGRLKNTITSYNEMSQAAQFRFQAEVDAVSAQTAALIIEIEKTRTLAQASQTHMDRISALVYMLGEIVKVDGGRGSEFTQAKARLLQASASHEATLARIVDLEIQLRKLAGEGPYPRAYTATWQMRPSENGPLMAALEQHPQIQQARHETASAEANAKAVKSSAYPQVNWVVEKTTAEDALGRTQPWQTNLSLSWGAFRGGALRAQRQAALARAEAGRQKAEQVRLDIEYEIRTSQHDARVLLERAEDYGDLAVENDRVRRAFFQQWHYLGRRTLLDVLSAENEFYANQVAEITSRFDGYNAIVKGYAGAGMLRDWLSR